MSDPFGTVPEDPTSAPPPGRMGRLASGLAGAALVMAILTVLARAAGFARWFVFSHTVGQTCLATAYATANQVPNVVFNVVAGGALASVIVPVLAGPVDRGDTAFGSRAASALLTWTTLITVPLVVAGLFVTGPVLRLLVPTHPAGCNGATVVALGAPMLAVFLPQILLYGVAVVLGGVLQAHRRFVAPALMPLVNSLLVIATYVCFAVLAGGHQGDPSALPGIARTVLAVGTTAGVLGLAVTVVVPMRRTGLRLRPTLRFPDGAGRRVAQLAAAGLAALVAQELSTVVVLRLANKVGGYVLFYNYAWALYLLPYAVLAVPLATSAFQRLSAYAHDRQRAAFADTTATTTRVLLVSCFLGAAGLAGVAEPVARVFVANTSGLSEPMVLAGAMIAFAPGVVGYGLIAHLGRALYAYGRGRAAATATVAGWLGVVVADIVLVALVPSTAIVSVLGWGNSIGMTVAGVLLVAGTMRAVGRDALAGTPKAMLVGAVSGAVSAFVGRQVGGVGGDLGIAGSIGQAVLAGLVVVVVFGTVAWLLDRRDLMALIGRIKRGRPRATRGGADGLDR